MITDLFSENAFIWPCLWQSTACMAAGLVGSFVLRRRPARAHQVLLLAMIVAVAVPIMSALVNHYELGVFVAEPVTIQPETEDRVAASDYEASGIVAAEDIEHKSRLVEKDSPAVMVDSESAIFAWGQVIFGGWIAASLILAARLVLTFVLGIRLLGRVSPLDCQKIREAVHTATAKLGPAKDLAVYSSRSVRSPIIWCWSKRPILLVPIDAGKSGNKIDWVSVLCHELAHYKRRDHISGLAAESMVCALPWNPLLWWAKSWLVRLSEQACDDWVVAAGQPGTDYAESLLDLAPGGQMAFVPAVVTSKKGLAARVTRILKDKCSNPKVGLRWAILAVIVAGFMAIGVAFAQTRPARPEPPSERQEKPTKSLHEAATDGDLHQIRLHLSTGTAVNTKDNKGRTALHYAASEGHTEIARLLIARGANINAKDKNGRTPLHLAAEENHKEVTELLLAKGADVNAKDEKGYTPLHYAALEGKFGIETAELLTLKGADVNAKNKYGLTPVSRALLSAGGGRQMVELLVSRGAKVSSLHLAAHRGDIDKVRNSLKEGKNVDARDEAGHTPLYYAASAGQMHVVEFLISKGADVHARDKRGETPLYYAADAGWSNVAELLIAKGADVNPKDNDGQTPLHVAADNGHKDVVELLITKGADVNAKDDRGWTALHQACLRGRKDMAEFLIDKGADINVRNKDGVVPLHYAVMVDDDGLVEFLLTKGADVNARSDVNNRRGSGWTALHVAARHNQKSIAELLIAKGADVNAKERGERTPLHAAALNGQKEVAEILIARGANINAKDEQGKTALHLAAGGVGRQITVGRGHLEVAELLIANGANVNAEDNRSRTPLWYANTRGHTEIVELLHKHGAKE